MSNLYAMQFSTGLVKVGRTKNVAARMEQHRVRLAVADIEVVQQYSAPCVGNALVAERALVARCLRVARASSGNEWFTGIPFDDVRAWLDSAAANTSAVRRETERSGLLDDVRTRLCAAGAPRWHAIADAVNAGKDDDARISFHTLRKIAYRDAKNPGIRTIQTLLDYFAAVDRGERELPEPTAQEAA